MFARLLLNVMRTSQAFPMISNPLTGLNQPTAGIATYYRWKRKIKNHRTKKLRRKLRFRLK